MTQNYDSQSKRVLLADDDSVIRHLVTSIVTREGYSVVAVSDGDEAFRILQRDSDFKAAIFDMMMPGLDGIDVLRHMSTEKRLLRIPVMIITSENDLVLMTELFEAGATAILPKPFSSTQIKTMLHMLIGQQQRNVDQFSKKETSGFHWRIGAPV